MDTVANMLTVIRNAEAVQKPAVMVPYSHLKYEVAKILERKGFVLNVEKKNKKAKKNDKVRPYLEIVLKYTQNLPAISGFKKISTARTKNIYSRGGHPKGQAGSGDCHHFNFQRINDRIRGQKSKSRRRNDVRNLVDNQYI